MDTLIVTFIEVIVTLGIWAVAISVLDSQRKISILYKILLFISILYIINFVRFKFGVNTDLNDVQVEKVDTIAYNGDTLLLNGEKIKIQKCYSNYKMPCNIIIRGVRKNNTLIPGIFDGESEYNVLIVTSECYDKIIPFIGVVKDNDIFNKYTKYALKYVKELGYTQNIALEANEVVKTSVAESKDNSEILMSKIDELSNKIDDMQKQLQVEKDKQHGNTLVLVIASVAILWLMGLITYVVVMKTNSRIKQDLITLSSDAKIREGVMLESRDTR